MEFIFSVDEIDAVALQFLEKLKNYKVFAFSGELGVGKTTFIRALCKNLGASENVTSPTYSIIQEYATKAGHIIYHMDLYRIKSAAEAMEAGILDCLESGEICFVEWPEKAVEIFPELTIYSSLNVVDTWHRKLNVILPG